MAGLKLNPYIARGGDARKLMEYYHEIFGGKLDLQTYGESPMPASDSHKDLILHGMLQNDDLTIMASDAPENMPLSSTHSNISLSLSGSDEGKLRKIFEGLGQDGKVSMPLEKQFWGDVFGMVDDKFGTHWMVNIDSGEAPAGKPE
jgi:PhnB protein